MNISENSKVTVKVLFFASARDLSGKSEVQQIVKKHILGKDLLSFICTEYNLEPIKNNLILAINSEFVELNSIVNLEEGVEVAIIPPLSGGEARRMDHLHLVDEKLNIENITDQVSSPSCGAVSVFIGTTRDNFENKKVTKLEYEAYKPMALKSLNAVCAMVREKFKVENIAIYHRLGEVPVKEASVVIAISSPHRKDSLDAVSCAIDALKASVPIWKKEVYAGEYEPQWKANTEYPDSNDTVEVEEQDEDIPDHLIQIKADSKEIRRRIESFINMKRNQGNERNIQQFCMFDLNNTTIDGCARTTAAYSKRKEVNSHVKVHRVKNEVGPQTHGTHEDVSTCKKSKTLIGTEERLSNMEVHLKLDQVEQNKNIFVRLKALEDKIMYLESLSPEYFQLINNSVNNQEARKQSSKRNISREELRTKIQDLEQRLFN